MLKSRSALLLKLGESGNLTYNKVNKAYMIKLLVEKSVQQ